MSDHTVIAMQSEGPEKGLRANPPRDYLLFSLFNILVLGNPCCLSFMALVYSVKSRDRKLTGDMNGALNYANTSKQLNIGAIILNVFLLIVFIILFFLYVVPSIQAMSKH
ncbi:interferon-induced transmembrane protein 3-like [Notamacropus eugenii]|uniref:Interferon inducible transmembrane protein B n=1 Tax=Notamacropus eugenii TaxID=9315 RepID=I1ZHT0_NOTEU|nr:interferon inducible transmembrane protein B [Notamacropus eugenii]